jgi:hypothetical protein
LLNLVAGLTEPTAGVLICAGREIAGPGPDRGVVFQNHSLLPWLTCAENIYLAVERVFGASENRAQLKARTLKALDLVQLGHAADKRPNEPAPEPAVHAEAVEQHHRLTCTDHADMDPRAIAHRDVVRFRCQAEIPSEWGSRYRVSGSPYAPAPV